MNEHDELIRTALRDLAGQAAPPRFSADVAWRAGRRRRGAAMTAWVAGAAAVAALVPLAVVFSVPSRPAPGRPLAESAGAHRPSPVQLRQVARITPGQCPPRSHGLPDTSKRECFYFTHTGMTVSRFASITVTYGPGATSPPTGTSEYWLSFRFQRADIRRFFDLTQKMMNFPSPRNQMAFIAHGVVLLHPVVGAALGVGVLQVQAAPTRAQARELLRLLEHR
jgi:hypothetical protein